MGLRSIAIPSELHLTYTGSLAKDSFPLVSMLGCGPLLYLYWRNRRHLDLGLFLSGFCVAWLYHWCHTEPQGLRHSSAFGLSGPAWRTMDIVYAQWLLARTFGHALGAKHWATLGVANALYVPCIIGCFTIAESPTLGNLAGWLLVILVLTLACKLVLEGRGSFPPGLHSWTGLRCLGAFLVAFCAFPLPRWNPKSYWLWHSIWHLGCSVGYHQLYTALDARPAPVSRKFRAGPRGKVDITAAGNSVKPGGKAE